MPPRKVYYLFLAFLYCFVLLTLAWFKDTQLLWGFKRGPSYVHPGLLLGGVVLGFILTAMASKGGMTICTVLLVLLSVGAFEGRLMNRPFDSLQYHVIVSLVVICAYGWIQILDRKL